MFIVKSFCGSLKARLTVIRSFNAICLLMGNMASLKHDICSKFNCYFSCASNKAHIVNG